MDEQSKPVLIPVRFITDDSFPTVSPKTPTFNPSFSSSFNPSFSQSNIPIMKPFSIPVHNSSHVTSFISIVPSTDNTFFILFVSFGSLCLFITLLWLAHCTFLVYTQPQKKLFVIFLFQKPPNKTFNI